MKKIFFLDGFMLLVSLSFTIRFDINTLEPRKLMVFCIFTLCSLYTLWKTSIILKHPPNKKLQWVEKLSCFALILGKLDFLLMVIRFMHFNSNLDDSPMLILFAILEFTFLKYSYVRQNSIVSLSLGLVPINKLNVFTVAQMYGYYYVHGSTKDRKNVHIRFSREEYLDFESNKI